MYSTNILYGCTEKFRESEEHFKNRTSRVNRDHSERIGSQNIDAAILVQSFDVSTDISLPFAAVITMGTLEPRLFATLVTQVPLQGAFPYEYSGALVTLVPLAIIIGTSILPVEIRGIDICEHRAIPIGY